MPQTSTAPAAKVYPDWMIDSVQQYKTALTGGAKADDGRYCLCREFDRYGECAHTDFIKKNQLEESHV